MSPFFDADQIARLRQPHTARTVDRSLVSRLLEPFWQACALAVPSWVAPNAITLSGLVLVAASFTAVAITNPSFAGATPRVVNVVAILAIFAFQTLDAMDGKQARRTGSSSALGNWCDHACDVAAVQMAMAGAGGAIGLGASGAMLFLLGSVVTNNYIIHWETRHTNTLYMGNGTSIYEAQLMMMLVHAITFVVGVEPWGRPLAELAPVLRAAPGSAAPVRLWLVVVGVGAIGGVGIVGSVVRVARAKKATAPVLAELLAPVALCGTGAALVHGVGRFADERLPLPFVFSVSLLGLHLIARQILNQLVGSRMKLVDPVLAPLVVTAVVVPQLTDPTTVRVLGWANLALALGVFFSTYLGATFAIARALGIPILTLPKVSVGVGEPIADE